MPFYIIIFLNTKDVKKLLILTLQSTELQKTLEENLKIYTLTKQDEENKLNDLENQLVDNLEELKDLPYLRDDKKEIEDTMKEKDNIWIAENNEEIHKFRLQMQVCKLSMIFINNLQCFKVTH